MANQDYVGDNNPAVLMYAHDKGLLPDYFLDSEEVTPDAVKNLYKVAFADPDNRKFPCHTKAACLHSALWYAANNMQEPAVKAGIEKFAAVHDIKEDVNKVFSTFAEEFEKSAAAKEEAAPEKKYALMVDFEGFQGRGVEGFYPINNAYQVKEAASKAFSDYWAGKLPLPQFRKAANAIMKAAEAMEVDSDEMDPTVQSVGADRLPDTMHAENQARLRKNAGIDPAPYIQIIANVDEGLAKSANSIEDLIDLGELAAEAILDLDLANGLTKYSSDLQDPYSMIFSGPMVSDFIKAASQCVNLRGVQVPVTDFLNLSDSKIDKFFSPGIGVIIKSAKKDLEGENSIEKCASAGLRLEGLSKDASNILLRVLADTSW